MNDDAKHVTRRDFIRNTAVGAAALGLGGAAAWWGPSLISTGDGDGSSTVSLRQMGVGAPAVDPSLVRYRSVVNERVAHDARLLAMDSRGRRVIGSGDQVLWLDGGREVQRVVPGGALSAIAVYGDEVFVATGQRVHHIASDGAAVADWAIPMDRGYITDLAVDREHVFVACFYDRTGVIYRCDKSGGILNSIGERDAARNIDGFVIPSPLFSIALGEEGLLWATNTGRHRVDAYTFDGDLELSWGRASSEIDGFCGCCNPISLRSLSDGRLVTAEKGIKRIKVYRRNGELDCVVAGPDVFTAHGGGSGLAASEDVRVKAMPLCVSADSHHIYALDISGGRYHQFDETDSVSGGGGA